MLCGSVEEFLPGFQRVGQFYSSLEEQLPGAQVCSVGQWKSSFLAFRDPVYFFFTGTAIAWCSGLLWRSMEEYLPGIRRSWDLCTTMEGNFFLKQMLYFCFQHNDLKNLEWSFCSRMTNVMWLLFGFVFIFSYINGLRVHYKNVIDLSFFIF